MGRSGRLVASLAESRVQQQTDFGGKAAALGRLFQAGFVIPKGLALCQSAYVEHLRSGDLERVIRVELGRKPLESMRWEEMWDAALRIRNAFQTVPVPEAVAVELRSAIKALGITGKLAVRSSAIGEDSAGQSFAGLHESVVGVEGWEDTLDAVRTVWASLWSDAAILYRRELGLDPARSRMAVVIQELTERDRSGVAFGRDPRETAADIALIEAVAGPCHLLVDGAVDPDRWTLRRSTGETLEWKPSSDSSTGQPLLETGDLSSILETLGRLEGLFGWPPDVEWTGRGDSLVLLQARPVTTGEETANDEKSRYLELRPGSGRLRALAKLVAEERIPALQEEGERLAAERLADLTDEQLAAVIEERSALYRKWKDIYWDEFIPFAHGVRRLATYYNDLLHPEDPYEFVGLLQNEEMLASRRNRGMTKLARILQENPELKREIRELLSEGGPSVEAMSSRLANLSSYSEGDSFLEGFRELNDSAFDVAYQGQRMSARPDLVLAAVLQMSEKNLGERREPDDSPDQTSRRGLLEDRLLKAAGEANRAEAEEVLRVGRLSWRLRDDDNILLGRVESQLARAVEVATERLQKAGRMKAAPHESAGMATLIASALRDPRAEAVNLPERKGPPDPSTGDRATARQLVGQPSAPGFATGRARCIRGIEDLGGFQAGEVLVCDAIQPTMTHLVPLASGIVERRGGMLIHGAIIARELGLPCVNGVPRLMEMIRNGDLVSVDGNLGIVTLGEPDFQLELSS